MGQNCARIFSNIYENYKIDHELVAYVPTEAPVISIYLDTTADENGRSTYDIWCKNEIAKAARQFEKESAAAVDFDTATGR